jgi:hypothetical protein
VDAADRLEHERRRLALADKGVGPGGTGSGLILRPGAEHDHARGVAQAVARHQQLAGKLLRHVPVEQDDRRAEREDASHKVGPRAKGAEHLKVGLLLEQEHERSPHMSLSFNYDNAHSHPLSVWRRR